MKTQEILKRYISFFEKRGHKQIPNVSLIPEGDSSLLYVNSGMFPLVPYLTGRAHPLGKRLVNVQRALRFFEDVDNIGSDNRHTTAFHMIGNWSLGDYFKREQLFWIYEFLVEELGLDIKKIYSSVFAGDEFAPKDEEAIEILKEIFKKYEVNAKEGERIFLYGREDNWWKRSEEVGDLGGPDSEIFYYIGEGEGVGKNPADHQDEFIEIGNSVSMYYKRAQNGGWEEIAQRNIDFGGGIERIALAVQGKHDIFETDNFYDVIKKIEELSGFPYGKDISQRRSMRIIADHMRASVFLAMDGVIPSNKDQGYILRRLLRKIVTHATKLGIQEHVMSELTPQVTAMLSWIYPDLMTKQEGIQNLFEEEERKFRSTLKNAEKQVNKYLQTFADNGEVNEETIAKQGFEFLQSLGYPADTFFDEIRERNGMVDIDAVREEYTRVFNEHQQVSRKGMETRFKK